MQIRSWVARALAVLFLFIPWVPGLRADTVVLVDGSEMTGTVLDLQGDLLHLRDERGNQTAIARGRIARIVFEAPAPKLKVEVRCAAGDDEMDLLLNGDLVQERVGSLGTGWQDISDRLAGGNNRFEIRVRNERASWAYRWELRINGKMRAFSCGQPGVRGKGCTCCGLTGNETGPVGPFDPVWLHVDKGAGSAEILGP